MSPVKELAYPLGDSGDESSMGPLRIDTIDGVHGGDKEEDSDLEFLEKLGRV